MAKTPVGLEIKSLKVFESKFESGGKVAAKKAAEKAFKASSDYEIGVPAKNGGYFIALKISVTLDKAKRTTQGSSTWEINVNENGQRKMFPAVRQSRPATATVPDVNPEKVLQSDVDEAVAGSVEAEVTGILKKLP
jgi:hypothetical protein